MFPSALRRARVSRGAFQGIPFSSGLATIHQLCPYPRNSCNTRRGRRERAARVRRTLPGAYQTTSAMAPTSKRQKKDTRCEWCLSAPDYIQYHDEEWGVPLYDDKKVFEFLLLETFQAGLSWLTVLRKRVAFAKAFHDFDIDRIAAMTDKDVERLQQNASIIRHKLKIRAAIDNARAVITMREDGMGLAHYFWNWVDYVPQHNCKNGRSLSKNELSDKIAKDLKKRGFKFVGSTIIYAHLQATGVINDHHPNCPRYKEVQKLVKEKPKL
eukprot:TRINITY_DN16608_c0_g1_i1.p1 TRINITY_DN16608_c0_g1~~TRINITY_DN16608_c0_g1_i1.p1  ORF type:complete len:269 (-),score=34.12 TRINITY_DN16608_c0_g1_i1:1108-1914(-)